MCLKATNYFYICGNWPQIYLKIMKKRLRKLLKFIGVIVLVVLILGFITYRYFMNIFMEFEGDYVENTSFESLEIDGLRFLDRNANNQLDIYEDHRQTIAARVEDALSQMTIEEKIHLLKGAGIKSAAGLNEEGEGIAGAVGLIVPTPRLGLPTIYLSDGPAGLRINPTRKGEDRSYFATAFPIATMLAATWNDSLVTEVGASMGNEGLEYGIDVILGPGVNIHRHPLTGRNFEYYSEDPVLTGYIGAAMVNGIESNGVGTAVKHYVANNQETERFLNDAQVSDRALHEIYLKGFEIIVREAQPWTIMSSYNKVNGTYTSESKYLLTDVLRDQWNFEGLVMTDWFGGQNAGQQIEAGNDLLEPGTRKQWRALKEGYAEETLSTEAIDRSARRILNLIFQSKKMEGYQYSDNPDLKKHAGVAQRAATEGIVLLKNEATLPLKSNTNVALLGVTSYEFIAGGTGSGDVSEAYTVSLKQGLENAGFVINKTASELFEKHKSAHSKEFEKPEGIPAMFTPYDPPELVFSTDQLTEIATGSDIGIITVGRNSGEGGDRVLANDFLLNDQELNMIKNASEVFHKQNKKLLVVLNIGGVVETASWNSYPDGIVVAWQGGQEGGNAVANVLSGQDNPSGKLPMTFPVTIEDHASHANFPLDGDPISVTKMLGIMMFGQKEKDQSEMIRNKDYTLYEEGVYVGYRHFDKNQVDVSYPFGHGLSYTDFEYSDMEVALVNDTISLALSIKNVGVVPGKEVVQIYFSKEQSQIDRPVNELVKYAKTRLLAAGEIQKLAFEIPVSDLSYWDEKRNDWNLEKGVYSLKAARSSRAVELTEQVTFD